MIDQLEGQVSMFGADGRFGKTCQAHLDRMPELTSKPSCKPSAKSQTQTFMFLSLKAESGRRQDASWEMVTALPGVSMTLNTGESPSETEIQAMCDRLGRHNVGSASTLSQILQANAPEKYSLSAKACAGILRRAEKRGKELPTMLREALEEVISMNA